MQRIMNGLIILTILYGLSAATGIQSYHSDSHATEISYSTSYGRLYAAFIAIASAAAFYAIYRRYQFTWMLGFFVLPTLAVATICDAWLRFASVPAGWAITSVVSIISIAFTIYAIYWWQRHKAYFIQDEPEET